MGGRNSYLDRQRALIDAAFDAGVDTGMQRALDYIQIVLSDPEIMRRDTFGRKRLEEIFAGIKATDKKYYLAYSLHKEADYLQEKMDAELRRAWGDDVDPFFERYPHLMPFKYDKARKEWK